MVSSLPLEENKNLKEKLQVNYVPKPLDELKFIEILQSIVLPTLSNEKQDFLKELDYQGYINQLQKDLKDNQAFLKEQHYLLNQRREAIKKIREKINRFKNSFK